MRLTGGMRYLLNGEWVYCNYGMRAMCRVIEEDTPYELEGRDYDAIR